MPTLHIFPDALILALLAERTQATCRLPPGDVRTRPAHLEGLRHVASRKDARLTPPARAFLITGEGTRRVKR